MIPQEESELIGKYISMLYRQAQKYISREMQPYELGSSGHFFLIHISKHEGINQRQLSQYLSIDEALTTRTMRKLEEEGFIIREKDGEDLRSYSLKLTEKGFALIPIIKQKFKDWGEILAKSMDEAQVKQLVCLLEQMSEYAKEAIER